MANQYHQHADGKTLVATVQQRYSTLIIEILLKKYKDGSWEFTLLESEKYLYCLKKFVSIKTNEFKTTIQEKRDELLYLTGVILLLDDNAFIGKKFDFTLRFEETSLKVTSKKNKNQDKTASLEVILISKDERTVIEFCSTSNFKKNIKKGEISPLKVVKKNTKKSAPNATPTNSLLTGYAYILPLVSGIISIATFVFANKSIVTSTLLTSALTAVKFTVFGLAIAFPYLGIALAGFTLATWAIIYCKRNNIGLEDIANSFVGTIKKCVGCFGHGVGQNMGLFEKTSCLNIKSPVGRDRQREKTLLNQHSKAFGT